MFHHSEFNRARASRRRVLLLAGALLLSCGGADAAPAGRSTAPADTAHYTLDPIVVTAVGPSSPLTFTTDPRKPRQPVPASDGADYLRTIPGFSAIRNGGTNGDVVLRGMFGSRVNVLNDGACMQGACPGRMDAPTSYIAPESFDRMVVVKGPESVAWGPGASAGTVRFERATEAFTAPGVRAAGNMLGGSWGRNDQLAEFAAGAGKGFARVTASRAQSDDYEDGDGAIVPTRWMKWNVDGTLGWTPGRGTRVETNAGTGDGSARYAGRGMDGTRFERRSAGVKLQQELELGALHSLSAQASYRNADHVMDNYTMRTPDPMSSMPMAMAANVDRRTISSRLAGTFGWREVVRLLAGLDQSTNLHRGRSSMGDAYLQKPWTEDAQFGNLGAFAEASWNAGTRTHLVSGARVDRASAQDRRAATGGMMPMPNPTRSQTRISTMPSGFARLVRDLSPAASVYAGLGHSERFPDYWELFSPDQGPMGSVNAFAGIRSEKTTQLDVGVQVSAPHARAWSSLYAGKVRDYILFRYMPGGMMGPVSAATNVDARTAGGEAGVAGTLAHRWQGEASIAYAWGQNRTEKLPLAQVPPLESRLTLGYDDGRTWSFGTLLRLVARQDRVAVGEGNVVGWDLGTNPGFGVLSLNSSRRLTDVVQLALGVDNLLDRTFSEHLNLAGDSAFGYPAEPVRIHEPGRTIWIKLNVKS